MKKLLKGSFASLLILILILDACNKKDQIDSTEHSSVKKLKPNQARLERRTQ